MAAVTVPGGRGGGKRRRRGSFRLPGGAQLPAWCGAGAGAHSASDVPSQKAQNKRETNIANKGRSTVNVREVDISGRSGPPTGGGRLTLEYGRLTVKFSRLI